jgi:16S rRNA (uracil1498-N3)-methyltransferase
LQRRGAFLVLTAAHTPLPESILDLTLVQALPKSDAMDLIVQKATELGVTRIVPVLAERSIVKVDAKQRERKLEHWRSIAISACEQCGRNRVPPVAPSLAFGEYFAALPAAGTRILLAPDGAETLRSLAVAPPVAVLIGPEGGLAPEERRIAAAAGYLTVRFGPRVLRTETAPLATLAALQALYGDC